MEFARLTQKLLWERCYPSLTRRLSADDVLFLNLGYEEVPPTGLPLVASDELNRFYIQLYRRTATQADLSGAQVLEVSCGHGAELRTSYAPCTRQRISCMWIYGPATLLPPVPSRVVRPV